jgi:hypothetical protein
MTQGHNHPDYDALMHHPHGASLAHAPPHPAHTLAGHAAHPAAPPPHAMVPVHEVHSLLHGIRGEMAQMREHQQRQAHLPPPVAHFPSHHEARHEYEERERRERGERREHRQHHNEPDYAAPRRARQRPAPGPLKIREFPVGFVQDGIAAGANAEIEVKPQVRFQGHRLAVKASVARYFNIVDIKVGKDSQLAATGEMPAEAFSSLAVGTQMELDCAPPGIVITLIVHNVDTATHDFGAVLYGEVEEGGDD